MSVRTFRFRERRPSDCSGRTGLCRTARRGGEVQIISRVQVAEAAVVMDLDRMLDAEAPDGNDIHDSSRDVKAGDVDQVTFVELPSHTVKVDGVAAGVNPHWP